MAFSAARPVALGALTAALIGSAVAATPVANAGAPCAASTAANIASGVLGAMGGYLDGHPDADAVVTAAGNQNAGQAKSSLTTYFATHPQQMLDLKGIADPLINFKRQCNITMNAGQLAALIQSFG
ncbi:MAG: hemophore-related protein [Mycobacterium sp.]